MIEGGDTTYMLVAVLPPSNEQVDRTRIRNTFNYHFEDFPHSTSVSELAKLEGCSPQIAMEVALEMVRMRELQGFVFKTFLDQWWFGFGKYPTGMDCYNRYVISDGRVNLIVDDDLMRVLERASSCQPKNNWNGVDGKKQALQLLPHFS